MTVYRYMESESTHYKDTVSAEVERQNVCHWSLLTTSHNYALRVANGMPHNNLLWEYSLTCQNGQPN